MRKSFALPLCAGLLCLLTGIVPARAQEHATLHPDTPPGIPLGKTPAGAVSGEPAKEDEEVSYVPKIDGAVKAKFELSTYDGEFRFNVRNSRFGVSGNVSRHMIYRMQVDFSNEGKVSILDAYAGYRAGNWDFQLGQQQYHFSTDLDRGPNSNMFANRSFLSKYLTSYYGSELVDGKPKTFVRTLGSRDLGAMATYTFKMRYPVKLYFGVFNGSGINNPQWGKTVNLVGRVEVGRATEGLRMAVAYYDGSAPQHDRVVEKDGMYEQVPFAQTMRIGGVELRYTRGYFFIEGEYARRYLEGYDGKTQVLTASHIHSYYRFPMRPTSVLNHIAPIVRWDLGNGMDYLNTQTKQRQTIDANRITAGVNFGFGKKFTRSEIRINYEKYILKNQPSDLPVNKLLQDKFTVEVVAAF